jgi:hypothetical protein
MFKTLERHKSGCRDATTTTSLGAVEFKTMEFPSACGADKAHNGGFEGTPFPLATC